MMNILIAILMMIPNEPQPRKLSTFFNQDFVWIAPGQFEMGSRLSPSEIQKNYGFEFTKDHQDDWKNQLPLHVVKIKKGFWMASTEVTVGQFRQFVNETGYVTDAERNGNAFGHTDKGFQKIKGLTWRNPGWEVTDNHPVCVVSWKDTQAFMDWLNQKNEGTFRLPTEQEWEYAARAGSQANFFWGDQSAEASPYANVLDAYFDCEDGYRFTAPVGQFKPNPWGLYDMVGNVWEWCESYFERSYQPGSKKTKDRVDRGGAWDSPPYNARLANRGSASKQFRAVNLGFRLVRDPD